MRKTIILSVLIIFSFLCLSQSLIKIDFEKTGFSIGIPESWEFHKNDLDSLALIADSSDMNNIRLSVYSDTNFYGNDIERLYTEFAENFFSNFTKYLVLETNISGNTLTCDYIAFNDTEYKGVFDIIMRNERFYILSLNGHKEEFSNKKDTISEIRKSFLLIDISNTYINRDAGFSIRFPEGWKHSLSSDGSIYSAQSRSGENINISFSEKYNESVDFQQYIHKYVMYLEYSLYDFQYLDSGEEKVDDISIFWLKYSFIFEDRKLTQKVYLFESDARFFSINSTALADDFANFEKIFEECVSSFRRIKQPQYRL